MRVIVCLDDKKGMLFNKRRQSQDRAVREDMIDSLQGAKLWMNAYSYRQFKEDPQIPVMVEEEFLDHAGEEDYCYVENLPLAGYEEKISMFILYHWNRQYPADTYFEPELKNWELFSSKEFQGYSHEKITKEIYIRKGK